MKERGYIKIYRGILDDDLGRSTHFPTSLCWIDLLLQAEYTDGRIIAKRGISFTLKRGQVATTYDELAKRWNMSYKTAQKIVGFFLQDERITIDGGRVITIINILNYSLYQYETGKQNAEQKSPICAEQNSLITESISNDYKISTEKRAEQITEQNCEILPNRLKEKEISPLQPLSIEKEKIIKEKENSNNDNNACARESESPEEHPPRWANTLGLEPYTLTLEQEEEKLKGDMGWLSTIEIMHGAFTTQLREYIHDFFTTCKANGIQHHKSIQDAKYHFNNWMFKVHPKYKQQTPTTNESNSTQSDDRRRGYILRPDEAKDYHSEF